MQGTRGGKGGGEISTYTHYRSWTLSWVRRCIKRTPKNPATAKREKPAIRMTRSHIASASDATCPESLSYRGTPNIQCAMAKANKKPRPARPRKRHPLKTRLKISGFIAVKYIKSRLRKSAFNSAVTRRSACPWSTQRHPPAVHPASPLRAARGRGL